MQQQQQTKRTTSGAATNRNRDESRAVAVNNKENYLFASYKSFHWFLFVFRLEKRASDFGREILERATAGGSATNDLDVNSRNFAERPVRLQQAAINNRCNEKSLKSWPLVSI